VHAAAGCTALKSSSLHVLVSQRVMIVIWTVLGAGHPLSAIEKPHLPVRSASPDLSWTTLHFLPALPSYCACPLLHFGIPESVFNAKPARRNVGSKQDRSRLQESLPRSRSLLIFSARQAADAGGPGRCARHHAKPGVRRHGVSNVQSTLFALTCLRGQMERHHAGPIVPCAKLTWVSLGELYPHRGLSFSYLSLVPLRSYKVRV